MVRSLALTLLTLFVASPAAADVSTCLTEGGLRVAPWTDAQDPACGADCGPDGVDDLGELCGADGVGCTEGLEIGVLVMPRPLGVEAPSAPTGPRCLDAGPTCGEGQPGGLAGSLAGAAALAPTSTPFPRRAPGSLPGASPWSFLAVGALGVGGLEPPPPRAARA